MFTTFIVQPIFNLLVLIYALIPGHNFGLAIIIFTIIIRLLMWPLVKKQLHHAKAIRQLQPEIKRIKELTGKDKREEQRLTMELYKEREINPLSSLGIIIVQFIILIGLYSGLRKVLNNPHEILNFSYPFLHHLSWMQSLSHDIGRFDNTLFGVVDLDRTASGPKGMYWPAFIIVLASALTQFFQSKQLLPKSQDSRSLRQILSEAGSGKSADQQEVNAAVGRTTMYFIPAVVLLVSLRLPVALPLYWLTGSIVAIIQQDRALKEDVQEAETTNEIKPTRKQLKTKAGLKVSFSSETTPTKSQKSSSKTKNKRRRK